MIRLTLVTDAQRGTPEEFDTDDLGVAIAEYSRRHFGAGANAGPEKWVVAFVVEQGEARMGDGEAARRFSDIAGIERFRATR